MTIFCYFNFFFKFYIICGAILSFCTMESSSAFIFLWTRSRYILCLFIFFHKHFLWRSLFLSSAFFSLVDERHSITLIKLFFDVNMPSGKSCENWGHFSFVYVCMLLGVSVSEERKTSNLYLKYRRFCVKYS